MNALIIRLIVLFIIYCPIISIGQNSSVSISPGQIMIGDHLDLDLRYKSKGYNNTQFPQINDTSIGNFRVVELVKIDSFFSGSDVIISHHYKITCFEDSMQVFPSLKFITPYGVEMTKSYQIKVLSPDIDSAKDVKPIKNIILVPLTKQEIYSYLFISFILLALVLVIYLIYIKFIRKEKLFDREKTADPPHVVALQSLKIVENENLWQMGKTKEYYDRISDILRLYMEKRFGVKAMEQTTSQIVLSLTQLELPDGIGTEFEEILNKADLAKFARAEHEGEEHLAILKTAYNFVQKTQMANDVNRRSNAMVVRKFYGQNRYGYKSSAINQYTLRSMIKGLMTTLILLSLTIIVAYTLSIPYLLNIIAVNAFLFFLWAIILGTIFTLIYVYIIRGRYYSYLLTFDYNAVIIRHRDKIKTILNDQMTDLKLDKKGNLIIEDISGAKHNIPREIEYTEEVRERLEDIISIAQPKNQ